MRQVMAHRIDEEITVVTVVKTRDNKKLSIIQTDLFDRGLWERTTLDEALKMDRFFFSDLRRKAPLLPPHEKHWGMIAKKLLDSKKFKRTGNFRRSPIFSRKGGLDWEYERI